MSWSQCPCLLVISNWQNSGTQLHLTLRELRNAVWQFTQEKREIIQPMQPPPYANRVDIWKLNKWCMASARLHESRRPLGVSVSWRTPWTFTGPSVAMDLLGVSSLQPQIFLRDFLLGKSVLLPIPFKCTSWHQCSSQFGSIHHMCLQDCHTLTQ